VKKIASGEVDKLEVRLVARGFQQHSGGDNIQESNGQLNILMSKQFF
jgi:hypothetical protein